MADGSDAGTATALRTRGAVEAIGLTRIYGSGLTAVMALDSVSARFPAGELTAVMGPEGAGKTTLLACLAGLARADSGSLLLGDTDVTRLQESALTRLRRDHVGFIFETCNLLPQLTAAENIELPLRLAGRTPDRRWIGEIVEAGGMRRALDRVPAELTAAEQQRVSAVRALAGRPDVVFADEPTGSLDGRASADLLSFLRRTVHELGQTIVMVTKHPIASSFADRALVLVHGRLVDEVTEPTADILIDRLRSLRA